MDSKEMIRRTKQFGYGCINLCDTLEGTYLKNHVRGQLIRCSTSVASNYRAARLAQSEASFVAKVSICVEEADESALWIELIVDKTLLPQTYRKETNRLLKEANELTSIFIATRKTINLKNRKT